MKSIVQENTERCFICGAQAKVYGTAADDVDEVTDDEWDKVANAWNRRAK